MSTLRATLACALLVLAAACGDTTPTPYDDSWGAAGIAEGKADGVLDAAPVLALGATGRGYVEGAQLDVYALSLTRSDKIQVVMQVEDGDLAPHFTLFYGGSTKVRSASFTAEGGVLTKTYDVAESGLYYLVVQAYRGEGAGRYALTPTCTGGACTGTPGEVALTVPELDECLTAARECAFAALPAWNGAVGPARARTIFQSCLAAQEVDGATCKTACDTDAPWMVCDEIITALPFYADQSESCIGTLDACLSDCYELGQDNQHEEFHYTAIGTCFSWGFNGNCNAFAQATAACGGELAEDSQAWCQARCESTDGAWLDDLDQMCEESCQE